MTYYPPTLLPSYLPYADLDKIISVLCDNCLRFQYDNNLSVADREQHFDLTMQIIEFWCLELTEGNLP